MEGKEIPLKSENSNLDDDSDEEVEQEESESDETADNGSGLPVQNASKLLKYIQRDLNMLSDESKVKRKFGLMNLYNLFVIQETKIDKRVMQEILPAIQKPLLKRFSDPVEKWRELSILIIKEFYKQWEDLTITFPYIFPVLVEKLAAFDLDGTDSLPEVMKPPPSQKPKMIISPPEQSEEIRLLIAQIVTLMIKSTITDWFRAYLDDLITILRTLAMDPYGEVIREAWEAFYILWNNDTEILFHYTVMMGKSTFLALTHQHAKVRWAGLKALNAIMYWGVWKYTVDLFEALIGFRDPNVVPIKDFYEPSIKFNYFARFVVDRSTIVRETFYKTLASWLLRLPDKVDHEGRILPYMISALNDPNDNIQDLAFDLLEEMGMDYEEREEAKIRETKQYALEPEWTNNREFIGLPLPRPFKHRPRLGARIVVKSYTNRYLKAVYKELSDWIIENRQRAAHLLLSLIIYTEDYITQYLDHLMFNLYKAVLEKEDKILKLKLETWVVLIGRYWMPKSYIPFVFSAISGDYTFSWSQIGAINVFGCLAQGSIEVIPTSTNLDRIDNWFQRVFDVILENVIEPMDFELAEVLVGALARIIDAILIRAKDSKVKIESMLKYERSILKMMITAFGVFNIHSLFSKDSSEANTLLKNNLIALFDKFDWLIKTAKGIPEAELSSSETVLNKWLPVTFYNISKSWIAEWNFQDQSLRVFNGFINHMDYNNSNSVLDQSLIEIDTKESEELQERIKLYRKERDDEHMKRFDKHLYDLKSSQKLEAEAKALEDEKKRIEAIKYVETEQVSSTDPIIEEDTVRPKAISIESKNLQASSQDKEEIQYKNINFDEYYFPDTTIYNISSNIIIKMLQHRDFEMTKYAILKIKELIKLNLPNKLERSSNIFKILAAWLSIRFRNQTKRFEYHKILTSLLFEIKRDDQLEINLNSCHAFYDFINRLRVLYEVYQLELRQDATDIMYYFVNAYIEFLTYHKEQKDKILNENSFLNKIFVDLFALAAESEEKIRVISANTLQLIVDNFLPDSPIIKDAAYLSDLADFRKDLSKAFDSEEKSKKLEEYCSLEKEAVKYLYDDPSFFMQGIVKVTIDETHESTRDIFIDIIKSINKKLPYTAINDFKRANSLGMLKRIELLRHIIIPN